MGLARLDVSRNDRPALPLTLGARCFDARRERMVRQLPKLPQTTNQGCGITRGFSNHFCDTFGSLPPGRFVFEVWPFLVVSQKWIPFFPQPLGPKAWIVFAPRVPPVRRK